MTFEENLVSSYPRRNFLKWGILGVLLVGPVVASAFRLLRDNVVKFVYLGHLEEGVPNDQVRSLGGNGWFKYYDVQRWSVNQRETPFEPQELYAKYNGDFYTICAAFYRSENMTDKEQYAFVFEAFSKKMLLAMDAGVWGTTPLVGERVFNKWDDFWEVPEVKLVQASIEFAGKERDLSFQDIDSLVLELRQLPMA